MDNYMQSRTINVKINVEPIKELNMDRATTHTLPFNFFRVIKRLNKGNPKSNTSKAEDEISKAEDEVCKVEYDVCKVEHDVCKEEQLKEKQDKLLQSTAQSNLVTIYKEICPCNIADVDYTTSGSCGHTLDPLCNLFCDNIVFYYYFPDNDKYKGKDKTLIAKEYLAQYTLKIKRLLAEQDIIINKTHIKPLGLSTNERLYKQRSGFLIQRIKVALPDIILNKIIAFITNKDTLVNLEEQGVYLSDVDFTRDFKGLINKKQLVEYLLNVKNFRMEGDGERGEYTILNNGKYVSNNCLTFIGDGEYGTIRFKLYNKFVQSMESPSVRDSIGNHISDWCNNPQQILNNSIKNSLDTGLLRLEITYYYGGNNVPNIDYFIYNFSFLESIVPEEQIYYNPISIQWRQLLTKVNCNIILWDVENSIAFLGIYFNKLTGKVNGCFINNATTNSISNAIKLYTFNVPIAVITVDYDCVQSVINFNSRMFTKHIIPSKQKKLLKELTTYLTTGEKKLKTACKLEGFANPNERGLISPLVNLQYATKQKHLSKQTDKINIQLQEMESTIQFPTMSKKSINACANIEEVNVEEVSRRNRERDEEYNILVNKLEADKNRQEIYNRILDTFNSISYGNYINLLSITNGTVLTVKAIKMLNLVSKDSNIFTTVNLLTENTNGEYAIIKGNTFITKYCSTNINKWCLITTDIYAVLDSYCFNIKKVGNSNYNGNPYAKVEIEESKSIIRETIKTQDVIKIDKDKINSEFKEEKIEAQECTKIDGLIEDGTYKIGDTIVLHSYWEYKRNYLLKICKEEDICRYVVCNTFLREIVESIINSCSTTRISVVICNKKYNPNSKYTEYSFTIQTEDISKERETSPLDLTREFLKTKKQADCFLFVEEKIDAKQCKKIEELITDGTFKVGDILYLQSFMFYRRNYLLKVKKDNEIRYIVCNGFLKDLVGRLLNGETGIYVVIGDKTYNPTTKHTEHIFLRDKEDKEQIIADIEEEERSNLDNIKIEENKKKYGEIKWYFPHSEDAPNIKDGVLINSILKPNTPFKIIAVNMEKTINTNIRRHVPNLIKIGINNIEKWVLVKGKTALDIWNKVQEDNDVSFTYILVNKDIIKEL